MRTTLLAVLTIMMLAVPRLASAGGLELSLPLDGRVVRSFDDVGRFEPGHRGVDVEGGAGMPVTASAEGRVHFAGTVAGRPTVSIDHGNGWRTTYQPVSAAVRVGDEVAQGDRIGLLLPGHCTGSPCLHWGLTDGIAYADPLSYLEVPVVRLVPRGSAPAPPPPLPAASVPPPTGTLPADGRISSRFGPRVHPVTGVFKLHDGVDIAAPCGTPVRSWAAGTVVGSGYDGAYGYRIRINHGGVVTAYAHLGSATLRVGSNVAAEQTIGTVGNTGMSTGCHLHWMLWRDGRLVDPLAHTSQARG